jgi:two-component system, NtrC family, response regulator AtoC
MQRLKALIVDDEVELRKTVMTILQSLTPDFEFDFSQASNGREALEMVKRVGWDVVLMDVRMPELDGMEALKLIKEHDPRTFVVLMTAHANLQDAIEAIKHGAYDYVEKPVQSDRLVKIVRKSVEAREMVSGLVMSSPIFDDDVDSEFVGTSQQMRKVFDLTYRLGRVDTTVLIRGENGTGKELVARAIHYNSARKEGSFIAINCGAIPESLMESELFGHERGAFTGATERKIGKFQVANNGTLFLDEIAELPPEMQVKLLRVLQERKFMPVGSTREVKTTARIIAATNRNLEKMMQEGGFREDLFYRLNVMPIFLPPLRERKDDLPKLIDHFIRKFGKEHKRDIHQLTPAVMQLLENHTWPGNIRELENVIEHAFIVENTNVITPESLPDYLASPKVKPEMGRVPSGPLDYEAFKETSEKEFIVNALKMNKGRINQTVAFANIPKNTLLRKIKKYGIDVRQFMDD